MPEGFELVGAEQDIFDKTMAFESIREGAYLVIDVSSNENFVIDQDTEHTVIEEIKIGHYQGYIAISTSDNSCRLVWQTEDHLIDIHADNYQNREELIKIAENMKYIK